MTFCQLVKDYLNEKSGEGKNQFNWKRLLKFSSLSCPRPELNEIGIGFFINYSWIKLMIWLNMPRAQSGFIIQSTGTKNEAPRKNLISMQTKPGKIWKVAAWSFLEFHHVEQNWACMPYKIENFPTHHTFGQILLSTLLNYSRWPLASG